MFDVRIERRSLTRGTPEDHLLDAEAHARRAANWPERCALRAELIAAFTAYAEACGWGEAQAWAASRAYWRPRTDKPVQSPRERGEAVFREKAA